MQREHKMKCWNESKGKIKERTEKSFSFSQKLVVSFVQQKVSGTRSFSFYFSLSPSSSLQWPAVSYLDFFFLYVITFGSPFPLCRWKEEEYLVLFLISRSSVSWSLSPIPSWHESMLMMSRRKRERQVLKRSQVMVRMMEGEGRTEKILQCGENHCCQWIRSKKWKDWLTSVQKLDLLSHLSLDLSLPLSLALSAEVEVICDGAKQRIA